MGGITAGSKGIFDGFDLGLFIAFPFMVGASLLFFVPVHHGQDRRELGRPAAERLESGG